MPMEAELTTRRPRPGLAAARARDGGARAAREPVLQRRPARQPRALPHRLRRGPTAPASSSIFSLDTAIQAVGEGNYGRLGADQQQRYTDANAETMFSEPATGGTPDEQPGAMPEIFPSRPGDPSGRHAEHRPLLDLPLDVHAGVGHLRHRLAGRASAARRAARPRPRRLEVVPQVPDGQPSVAGSDIRLGRSGSVASSPHTKARHRKGVQAQAGLELAIGHTLPRGSTLVGVARRAARQAHDPQHQPRARGHRGHRAGNPYAGRRRG